MFNLAKRLIVILFLCISSAGHAVLIEAEGRAIVANGDLRSAREAAIQDASRQASLQAAVYVSSNQVVRDGILEIDNMQISTLGQVSNIEILDERLNGNVLKIRIRADVLIDTGCENGVTNTYTKTLAVAAFPVQNVSHLQLGGLGNTSVAFSNQLNRSILQQEQLDVINISTVNVLTNPAQAGTAELADGALASALHNINRYEVNYVVSGIIRDMSMVDPRTHKAKNYFIDQYNRLDYLSKKHLRTFVVEVFIHDGFTGNLVMQQEYQTAGLWSSNPRLKTGFGTAAFNQLEYGQKIAALRQEIATDIAERFECEPYTARIDRVEDNTIWISAGASAGIQEGDKLTVYRSSSFFTPDQKERIQLDNTRQTLTIENVQGTFSSGRISTTAQQNNIRPGDFVIAR